MSYVNAVGQTVQLTDEQGFLDNGGFNITQRGHAFNSAVYLSDSWRIDKWLLDASVRYENQDATNRVCNLYERGSRWQSADDLQQRRAGVQRHVRVTDYDEDFTSWTVGANYSFTDYMSAYVRVNRGGHFLDFDNGIRGSTTGNTPPDAGGAQLRGRASSSRTTCIYADISAYFRDFTGLQYQQTTANGAPTGARLFYGSESKGVNFIGAITPGENFRFQVVANLSRRRIHRLRRAVSRSPTW